jgi:class 3 adenylate cyclase
MYDATIVFVDLVGSTAIYQSLGNAKGAELVSGVTEWIGSTCKAAGGHVIRYLGDGVLMAFRQGTSAVECAIEIQRLQGERNAPLPSKQQAQLKVGMARGQIVEAQTGWIGEAINVASSLCDRCVPDQILATGLAIDQISLKNFARFRNLGSMFMPGKSQPMDVFQVEWRQDVGAGFQTVRGELQPVDFDESKPMGGIRLIGLGKEATFNRSELPIVVGRHESAHFSIFDPRVSRLHVKIYEHDDVLVLEDTSRHGTSVRFSTGDTVLILRNQECVLHDACEIALGSTFDPGNAPQFALSFVN